MDREIKVKDNKGITLVVLVVTIVLLIILSAVVIRSVSGDNLLEKAKDTRNTIIEYSNKTDKDNQNIYDAIKSKEED